MSVKRDFANTSAWEAELNKERAGALGLTARELEAALEVCRGLATTLDALPPGALRDLTLEDYREARTESERQRWNLCVQREAVGLRRHDEVDRFYPIAPKR
jgi:hypothetical protein